jgi:hypothetical protein
VIRKQLVVGIPQVPSMAFDTLAPGEHVSTWPVDAPVLHFPGIDHPGTGWCFRSPGRTE